MSHVPGEMGSGLMNDYDYTTSVTPEGFHEASHDAAPLVSLKHTEVAAPATAAQRSVLAESGD